MNFERILSAASKGAPWLLAVSIGVLIGVGTFTFDYAKGLSYFSDNPLACMNCHIMRDSYNSWIASSHHAVASCNACHVPHAFPEKYWIKAKNGWNHSKAFTLQNFTEPIRITKANLKVTEKACLHCHRDLLSQVAGHRDGALGRMRCAECHRSVGHRYL